MIASWKLQWTLLATLLAAQACVLNPHGEDPSVGANNDTTAGEGLPSSDSPEGEGPDDLGVIVPSGDDDGASPKSTTGDAGVPVDGGPDSLPDADAAPKDAAAEADGVAE